MVFFSGYNQIISYVSIENFLSKNKLDELKNLSLIVDANNKIKKKYNYKFLNEHNYEIEKIENAIYSNLQEEKLKKNYLELLSYLVFAFIFSLIVSMIYRSF